MASPVKCISASNRDSLLPPLGIGFQFRLVNQECGGKHSQIIRIADNRNFIRDDLSA